MRAVPAGERGVDRISELTELVRTGGGENPTRARFSQTTYEAAAELGGWDRSALEDDPNRLPRLSMRRS